MSDRPDPSLQDPDSVQQQKVKALMRWIRDVEGEPDWEARRLFLKPLTHGVEFVLQEKSSRGTGQAGGILPPEQAEDALELQRTMANDEGSWLDAMLTLTNSGTGDARFNYENEPPPLASETGYPVEELRAHLDAYPRTDEALTDWMRERLA